MGASNAIGTGAVVLTANSDALATGLAKARENVTQWATQTDAKVKSATAAGGGGSGGGLLRSVLFGGAVGAGVGAIGGIVSQFGGMFDDIQGRAARVRLSFGEQDSLKTAKRAVDQLSFTFERTLMQAIAAVAPAVEKIAPAIEAIVFIGGELFQLFVSGVGDVLKMVGQWADSTFDLGVTTNSASQTMFAAFKVVGKAVAYVYDTIKLIAGAVAYVAGVVTEGFGIVVKVIGEAVNMLAELAKELPDAIRPDWIQGCADAVKGWGNSIANAGAGMQAWGRQAIAGWGTSAQQVGEWVDNIQAKFERRPKVMLEPPKLGGALMKDSKEAYSAVVKWSSQDMIGAVDKERAKLDAALNANKIMQQILDQLKTMPMLQVF